MIYPVTGERHTSGEEDSDDNYAIRELSCCFPSHDFSEAFLFLDESKRTREKPEISFVGTPATYSATVYV